MDLEILNKRIETAEKLREENPNKFFNFLTEYCELKAGKDLLENSYNITELLCYMFCLGTPEIDKAFSDYPTEISTSVDKLEKIFLTKSLTVEKGLLMIKAFYEEVRRVERGKTEQKN